MGRSKGKYIIEKEKSLMMGSECIVDSNGQARLIKSLARNRGSNRGETYPD